MKKNKKEPIKVRLHFKENVDAKTEDALWEEVFKILGIFENPIGDKKLKNKN